MSNDSQGGVKEMSFLDHLEELRWHLVRAAVAIVVCAIVVFIAKDFVFGTVVFGPKDAGFVSYRVICALSGAVGLGEALCFAPPDFSFVTPVFGELFITHIKVSIILGFVVAFPYVFWEVWRFIGPGLNAVERRAARGTVGVCSFLFLAGICFGYFVIAPFAVSFLAGYEIEGVEATPSLASYVTYMAMFTVPSGLIFELPVVVYFLSGVGLVTPSFMRRYRRHAFILIIVVAAIITPPDVITQFLIAIPLYGLYEVSIAISGRVLKRQQN